MLIKLCKRYLKNYTKRMLLIFLFAMLQVGCQLILPQMTDRILNHGIADQDVHYILKIGMQMLGMTVLVGSCMVIGGYLSAYVTAAVLTDCRKDLFYRAATLSESDYAHFGIPSILNRLTSDMTTIQVMLINGLRSALLIPFTGIGALVVALSMNVSLTVVVLSSFVLTTIFLVICGKFSKRRFKKLNENLDISNGLVKEKILGARSIRAFGRQQSEDELVSGANEDIYKTAIWANHSVNFMSPVMQLIMNLVIVIVYFICAENIRDSLMDASTLIKFMQYILNFASSLTAVVTIIDALPRTEVSAERIMEIIDYSPEIVRDELLERREISDGKIEFQNVSFQYPGAELKVLEHIDLTIEPGTITAVIGATGSGKTTLLYTILRFFDVTEGKILIDGVDVKKWNLADLHSSISYAPQQAQVLHDTVYANLKMADPELTREDAEKALEKAQILDFLNASGENIDFVLEQNGRNVSGGQRQRLSLARMFARKNAAIYLLDDSLSALDMKTDQAIRDNIRKYLCNRTIVWVAQRIATILDADQIVVLKDGRICGTGTHKDLLRECDEYRKMCIAQQIIQEES